MGYIKVRKKWVQCVLVSRKKAFCRIDGMIEGVAEDTIKEQTGEGTKTVKNWIFT